MRGDLGPLTVWVTPDTIREKHESEEEWKQLYEAVRADPDHTAISQGAEQKQSPPGYPGYTPRAPLPLEGRGLARGWSWRRRVGVGARALRAVAGPACLGRGLTLTRAWPHWIPLRAAAAAAGRKITHICHRIIDAWQVHEPSRNEMVELVFTETVKLRPGQGCGFYVHSALPGDEVTKGVVG